MVVYLIQNRFNKKIYVGQTVRSIEERWYQHCKVGGCPALKASIALHGPNSFRISVVRECQSIEDLNFWEEVFIKHYDCLAPKGYNLNTGGKNARHSEESKRKIGIANKGKKRSEEAKARVSQVHSGKILSPDHKEAFHSPRRGKPMSEEHKRKISEALKGKSKSKDHKLALRKAALKGL